MSSRSSKKTMACPVRLGVVGVGNMGRCHAKSILDGGSLTFRKYEIPTPQFSVECKSGYARLLKTLQSP